jgi:hypothetical protein
VFKLVSKDRRDGENSNLLENAWVALEAQDLDFG